MGLLDRRGRLASGRALAGPFRPDLLPLMLIAAGFLAWWLWPSPRLATAAFVPTPIRGTRTLPMPLGIVLVIDESDSTSQTDPAARRHTEAVAIARWMTRYSENPRDEIGVVRFASDAAGSGPVPVRSAAKMLAVVFGRPANIGTGTVLAPAVSVVEQQLRPAAARRRVVIIISDGQLNHENSNDIEGLIRRLRATADSVYWVGLNGDGMWEKTTRALYENRGLAGIYTLDEFSRNVFAQALAQIVLRETGQAVRQHE